MEKVGRNDPCPCGSGKKYKACCLLQKKAPRKIKATWISQPKKEEENYYSDLPDLMERTFGDSIRKAEEESAPQKIKNEEIE